MPRVILVDDDPSVRTVMRAGLERMGIDIVGEGADGIEAVEVVRQLQPDVVLMDLQMPGMNGFEATREIKQHLPLVQVVFVTVYDDPHPTQSAEDVGAYAYLLKDSSFELIRDVVLRAANLKQELEVKHQREA
jgi:DNA-binding NarL/FixJ family response regulator